MTDDEIDCKGVISALDALTRNGELRDYDDELANRLEDAKEIVKRYTALSSAGRLAREELVCIACGMPWTGEKCGQAENGWDHLVCHPIASAPHPAPDATDWKARCEEAEDACADISRTMENTHALWLAAQAKNEKLREALERIMVGGNHVALLIGADHPPAGTDHDKALHHYGAGDQYEAWCCWNTIMLARNALSPPPLSPEKP